MKMYSTGEAARKLGVQPYKLSYMLSTGKLKEPAARMAGKRIWTEEEVSKAKKVLSTCKESKRKPDDKDKLKIKRVLIDANIDWALLRKQKEALAEHIEFSSNMEHKGTEELEGLSMFINHIQESAVATDQYTELEVFGKEEDEDDEG